MFVQAGEVRLWVAVVWQDAVLEERALRPGAPWRVADGLEEHLLFGGERGEAVVHLTPAARGHLSRDGARVSLQAWRTAEGDRPALRPGDRGLIELGRVAVVFELATAPTKPPPTPALARLDSSFLGTLNAAVAMHVGLLIAAFLIFDGGEASARQEPTQAPRFVAIDAWVQPPPAPPPPPAPARAAPAAPAMEGAEGALGRPEETRPTRVKRREAPPARRPGGVTTAIDDLGRTGALASVFARDPDFAGKLGPAVGDGHEDIVGHGSHGFGIRNTGSGGGGRLGYIGGVGDFAPGGGGRPGSQLGGRPAKARPQPPAVKTSVDGFCKESDILRVVNVRRNGVSYCYEKALIGNPALRGKLTMRWTIALDGTVQGAFVSDDTLRDAEVAGCVRRNLLRWRFTPPQGGQCVVQFPFVFSPGE